MSTLRPTVESCGPPTPVKVMFSSTFDCFTLCHSGHVCVYAVSDAGALVRRTSFSWPPDSVNSLASPCYNGNVSRLHERFPNDGAHSPDAIYQDVKSNLDSDVLDSPAFESALAGTKDAALNDSEDEDSDSWLAVSQEQADLQSSVAHAATVHLLENTNMLFAITFGGKSVYIYDDTKASIIARLRFVRQVEAIVVRRDYLVTLAADALYVHRLAVSSIASSPMKIKFPLQLLARIPTITPRPHPMPPLISVSDSSISQSAPFYIVVPSAKQCGYVVRLDMKILQPQLASNCSSQKNFSLDEFKPLLRVSPSAVGIFHAHEGSLHAITMSSNGAYIATASDRGTLVRVWEAKSLQLLHEFRRGADIATIQSMQFDLAASRLLVCSSKGTIHLFACRELQGSAKTTPSKDPDSSRSYIPSRHETPGRFSPLQSSATPVSSSNSQSRSSAPPSASSNRNPKSSLAFLAPLLPSYFASKWSYATFRFPRSNLTDAWQQKNVISQRKPSFNRNRSPVAKDSLNQKPIQVDSKTIGSSSPGLWINACFLQLPKLSKNITTSEREFCEPTRFSERVLAIASDGHAVVFEYDVTSMMNGSGKILSQWFLK